MTQERPPWFKCFPEKLLGALYVMPSSAQLLYVTILLRIYEVGGPIPDDVTTLSHRTWTKPYTVRQALAYLLEHGKIVKLDGGRIDSPSTHEFLAQRAVAIASRESAAQIRWAKVKQKQQGGDAHAMHMHMNVITEEEEDKERKKKIPKKKVDVLEILMVGGGLSEQTAKDVVEYRKARKAVLTARAIQMLAKEFFDSGEPELAAATMIRKNWQGFDRTWNWRPNGAAHPIAASSSGIWVSQEDPRWELFADRWKKAHQGKSPPVDRRGGWNFPGEA